MKQGKQRPSVGPAATRLGGNCCLDVRPIETLVDHARDKLLVLDHAQRLRAGGWEIARDRLADPARNVIIGAIDNRAVADQATAAFRLTISAHAAVTSNVI